MTDPSPALAADHRFEYWHCPNCDDYWVIQRGQDGWDGTCPDCGESMEPSGEGEFYEALYGELNTQAGIAALDAASDRPAGEES